MLKPEFYEVLKEFESFVPTEDECMIDKFHCTRLSDYRHGFKVYHHHINRRNNYFMIIFTDGTAGKVHLDKRFYALDLETPIIYDILDQRPHKIYDECDFFNFSLINNIKITYAELLIALKFSTNKLLFLDYFYGEV